MDSNSEFYTDDTEVPDFDKLNLEIRNKMLADINFEGKDNTKWTEKELSVSLCQEWAPPTEPITMPVR